MCAPSSSDQRDQETERGGCRATFQVDAKAEATSKLPKRQLPGKRELGNGKPQAGDGTARKATKNGERENKSQIKSQIGCRRHQDCVCCLQPHLAALYHKRVSARNTTLMQATHQLRTFRPRPPTPKTSPDECAKNISKTEEKQNNIIICDAQRQRSFKSIP